MSVPAENLHYTRTSVALHWLVAAGIISALCLGWFMTGLAISPTKVRLYNWHKWLGITLLGLAIARSLWRLTHRPPTLLPMPAWQQASAHALHSLLYLMMFLQPLIGWIYSNYSGYPIVYLGLVRLPTLVARNRAMASQWLGYHQVGAWVLVGAITLHVAAALKHHFVDRDDTLRRMLRSRSIKTFTGVSR